MRFLSSIIFLSFSFLIVEQAQALPIDWNGSVGFETNILNTFRKTNDDISSGGGSQAVDYDGTNTSGDPIGTDDYAGFQTYVFRLNPTILINDSASVKGEFSTGTIRGGFLGGNTNDGETGSNQSYYFTNTNGGSALNINLLYAELYADTALFRIGKFSKDYGLGVVQNNGDKTWDRFYSLYDGLEAEFKIGNFKAVPYWSKINVRGDDDGKIEPSGTNDITERGISGVYSNSNTGLTAGVLWNVREANSKNAIYNMNRGQGGDGGGKVTLVDVYFKKSWEKVSWSMEIPMLSGKVGKVYAGEKASNLNTNAFIMELDYESSKKWNLGLNGGLVKGDSGESRDFEGMYLHPNYQIAHILYRYNYSGFNNPDENIFDSAITNSRYAKLYANYQSERWTWKMSWITAQAIELAQKDKDFYHHEKGGKFTATESQEASLGNEFDFEFDYQWNPSVLVTGYFAYLFTGNYYAFSNTDEEIEVSNTYAAGMKVGLDF